MSTSSRDEYISKTTGEVLRRPLPGAGDFNFKKMWPKEIAEVASELTASDMRIMLWMMATCSKKNEVIGSYRSLAKCYGCANSVMSKTIAALKYADVIRRKGTARLMLNPNYIFSGGPNPRRKAYSEYSKLAPSVRAGKEKLPYSLAEIDVAAAVEPGGPLTKIKARQQKTLQKLDSNGVRGSIPEDSYRKQTMKKLTGKDAQQPALIKLSLQTLDDTGHSDLAASIGAFTDELLGGSPTTRAFSASLLDKIAALLSQAIAPPGQRNIQSIRTLDEAITTEVDGFPAIDRAWAAARVLLHTYWDKG